MSRALIYSTLLFLSASLAGHVLASNQERIDAEVAALLLNAPAETAGYDADDTGISATLQDTYNAYHENGLVALWVTEDGPNAHANALLDTLASAAADGINANDYQYSALEQHWQSTKASELALLDLLITQALVKWVNDISHGRVHTDPEHPERYVSSRDIRTPAPQVVAAYQASADPQAYLSGLFPQHRYYKGLKTALERYRDLASTNVWGQVPEDQPTLHPGERSAMVPAVRKRLAVIGTDTVGGSAADIYDPLLVQAVKKFQLYHGLAPDGVIGRQTVAAMNQTATYRIRQIEMNMERWRWLDHELGERYILVDIAGYDVQGVVDDRAEVEMRAIVGKLHHETPVFSDSIKYMEFNPYWNLTPSIARHETVPKARQDKNYLASKHIRVFDGWGPDAKELDPRSVNWNAVTNPGKFKFRQDPGPWNALGRVKFIFPNKYSVYLHDTPNHDLFSRAERDFSHGCIRLSEPTQLAKWVLQVDGSDWNATRIQEVLDSQERTVKTLQTPLPVHLTYETAWIDGDGEFRLAPDIYGRDALLEKALYGQSLWESD